MTDCWLRIQNGEEKSFYRCSIREENSLIYLKTQHNTEFAIEYDGEELRVNRSGELAYEMHFREGCEFQAVLVSPYGQSPLNYRTTKLTYTRGETAIEWEVEYKTTDGGKTPLTITCLTRVGGN